MEAAPAPELPGTQPLQLPECTTAFLRHAVAFFRSTLTHPRIADSWAAALDRAVRCVYFAVVVTEEALKRSDGQFDRSLLNQLTLLAERRVFVFVITSTGRLPTEFAEPPARLIPLTTDPAQILARLQHEGLRLDRVLRISLLSEEPSLFPRSIHAPQYVTPTFVVAPAAHNPAHVPAFSAVGPNIFEWATPDEDKRHAPPADYVLPVAREAGTLSCSEATTCLLAGLLLAFRINIAETSDSIDTKDSNPPLLRQFAAVKAVATRNLDTATTALRKLLPANLTGTQLPSLFDPRSGAIFFTPEEWRNLTESPAASPRKELLHYFDAGLPNFWQLDRPSKRRVLFTPTKVLLRGEQYYASMRNVSPFDRLAMLWKECDDLQDLWSAIAEQLNLCEFTNRKLLLAFFDQLRNISLQTLSFIHAGPPLFRKHSQLSLAAAFQELFGHEGQWVHKFAHCATNAYYGCLLGRDDLARSAARSAFEVWPGLVNELRRISDEATSIVSKQPVSVGSLVRRWREADHPGENLLTALAAATTVKAEAVTAVGIGWGGIELPLLYRFVRREFYGINRDTCLIARWSHYRKNSPPPEWDAFPGSQTELALLRDAIVVLFDDNTLTGITLERIRDHLLLMGASNVSMFVGRYSGERRAAQMRMPDHGAVDPELLQTEIRGFVGETPFARSWSKEEYENPIGVFSLSKRRILEYIHSNSTVDLYDREGF